MGFGILNQVRADESSEIISSFGELNKAGVVIIAWRKHLFQMSIDKSKYYFNWANNLIEFNSLSPNEKFYYQITKPKDMYWGLFVARISFLDTNNNLIFFDSNSYANPLQNNSNEPVSYCTYSKDGNMAYYLQRVSLNTLNHIIIDLEEHRHMTINWNKQKSGSSKLNQMGFDETELEMFEGVPWVKNKKNKRRERDFLFRKIWLPNTD